MDKNINVLDSVLLNENVVDSFYQEYNNNATFRIWLDKVLPEISKAEKMEQNNPWHIYNVLDHILHSVEEMNQLSMGLEYDDRRNLAYTMFLHDIGKPETHIRRMKGGKMIDSFFNHNVASERIADRVLPKLNFSRDDVDVIKKLVYKHDIFMFIKLEDTTNPYWKKLTPKLMDEHISDLKQVGDGNKLMRHLIMVGRADNLAQNPKMTSESLQLLNRCDEILNSIMQK